MMVGCLFNLGATLSFGYMRNFYLLMIARAMQALGGSLSVVSGELSAWKGIIDNMISRVVNRIDVNRANSVLLLRLRFVAVQMRVISSFSVSD